MGLLDNFSEFAKTPEGMGLLSAAFGGLAGARRDQPWNSLGRAGMAGVMGYSNAQEQQAQLAQMEQAKKLRQMQMDEMQAKMADEAKTREFFADPSRFMLTPASQALSNGQGPTNANASAMESITPQFDIKGMYQSMLKSGSPSLGMKAIEGLAKQESPKLKSIEKFEINGKVTPVQVFENGAVKTMNGFNVPPDIIMQNLGNRVVAINKNTLQGGENLALGVTPDAQLNASVTMRGQNMTDARAKEANHKPHFDASSQSWMVPPSSINPTGGMISTPFTNPPKGSAAYQEQASGKLLQILDQADKLLDVSTGSYIGAGADMAAQAFGASTQGAKASAQLKALEGAIMMAQPRMEGPQSDKDTAIYRQMAGQIGDSTLPVETRRAALNVIRELHTQYAKHGGRSTSGVIDFNSLRK